MCIAIICFLGWDVINFEIKLFLSNQAVFYMSKKPRQKFKYIENEKTFSGEIKSVFQIFQNLIPCDLSQNLNKYRQRNNLEP